MERAFLSKCHQEEEKQKEKELAAAAKKQQLQEQTNDSANVSPVNRPTHEITEILRPQPIQSLQPHPDADPRLFDPSCILKDFDAGPHDDPFIEAEFNTINDIAELRDVLSFEESSHSSPHTLVPGLRADIEKRGFGSLANISFPKLTATADKIAHSFTDLTTSSLSGSHSEIPAAFVDITSEKDTTKEESDKKTEDKDENDQMEKEEKYDTAEEDDDEEIEVDMKPSFTIIPIGQPSFLSQSNVDHSSSQPDQISTLNENFYSLNRIVSIIVTFE